MSNITLIEEIGECETCDLEVEHPDHQFYLANGVLTSNSHATAYAIDSYMCAWLLTHYEQEWLCAYLESMSGSPEDRATAFGEVRSMGYKIVPIDINHAGLSWTLLDGKRFMPSFLSCKGVGAAAVEEIEANRPYESVEQLLWNDDGTWKHSKLNKRALEALIKIGAMNSLDCIGEDKLFKNYRHMHEVIIENMDLIKKTSKKEPGLGRKNFYDLARGLADSCEPWSNKELAEFQTEYFGSVDVTSFVDQNVLAKLEERGVKSIDDLGDEPDIAWFCIESSVMKKTKNGRDYLTITAVGPSGKGKKVMVWNWNGAAKFSASALAFAEISKNDFGYSTTAGKLKVLS